MMEERRSFWRVNGIGDGNNLRTGTYEYDNDEEEFTEAR
jgi:hypothetical protein